jgi:hypothetical protein
MAAKAEMKVIMALMPIIISTISVINISIKSEIK